MRKIYYWIALGFLAVATLLEFFSPYVARYFSNFAVGIVVVGGVIAGWKEWRRRRLVRE